MWLWFIMMWGVDWPLTQRLPGRRKGFLCSFTGWWLWRFWCKVRHQQTPLAHYLTFGTAWWKRCVETRTLTCKYSNEEFWKKAANEEDVAENSWGGHLGKSNLTPEHFQKRKIEFYELRGVTALKSKRMKGIRNEAGLWKTSFTRVAAPQSFLQ